MENKTIEDILLLHDGKVDMIVRNRNEKDETLWWTAYYHDTKRKETYSRGGETVKEAIINLLGIV